MPLQPSTARRVDDNGYMLVEACPLSSYGIFDYGAGQLDMPGDPERVVKVFRPESAVADPQAIESFKNVPFIIEHEMLSGFPHDQTAEAPEQKGLDGVLTANVYYDAPWMRGDIKIFSRKAQEALKKGIKDLSLGYSCDFEIKSGVWNGQPYEAVQTNMRGNHIALVKEGRVPGARVLDGLVFDHLCFDVIPSGVDMKPKVKSKKAMDNAVEQLKALIPALEQYLSEESTEPAHGGSGAAAPPAHAASGNPPPSPPADDDQPVPPAAPTPPAAPPMDNDEPPEASGDDLSALVHQVESVLAKLKSAIEGCAPEAGGGGEAAPAAAPEPSGDALMDDDDTKDDDDVKDDDDTRDDDDVKDDDDTSDAMPPQFAKDDDDDIKDDDDVEDDVEGLKGIKDDDNVAGIGGGQGKAPPGPSAGKHATAGDAVFKRFYKDLAAKDKIYSRLSKVVGAFDHKSMSARDVSSYGVKKLGIRCADGQESLALDAYLNGVEAAAKATKQRVQKQAQDSAAASEELDAYLAGSK